MTTHPDEITPQEYPSLWNPPLNLPDDPLAHIRADLQRQYDFRPVIDATYDVIAAEILEYFQLAPGRGAAGVNHLDEHRHQEFVGVAGTDLRSMTCDQGACSTLITRRTVKGRTTLPLGNLMDFPLFATNDMVTVFEMETYFGAQILADEVIAEAAPEGVPIGTVWWIDTEPREYTEADREFMKGQARKVMDQLRQRRRQQ